MAAPVTLSDLLPLPAETDVVATPSTSPVASIPTGVDQAQRQDSVTATAEPQDYQRADQQSKTSPSTQSHKLAMADHEEKGAAQQEHEEEVVDLGWNEPEDKVEAPLVGGMDNEELWVLVRRFNKQIYHVKEYPYAVPGGLDLNIADDEEFSPDKLRSHIERFYMTIVIGVLAAVKQIARLRSWRETRRTATFCAVYFLAWLFDFLVPLFATTLIVLITYPPARTILFPPAPIALVSSSSGGIQKPKAGVLGSHDSATGAPENYKGEAVEQEASNFVNGIASVAISSAAGKHPQQEDETGHDIAQDAVPDPSAIAIGAAEAKEKVQGGKPAATHDKTKVPMETAMWTKMRPIMHGIAEVTDTWERFGNALSPTPPFPQDRDRVRLALVIVPLLCISLFTTSYMFVKGVTFGAGFGFFGDPIIQPALNLLNRKYPNWTKLLELRNTLLKGVPTNAQLTITLLRIGEANKAPLPPPPRVTEPPPEEPAEITDEQLRATGAEPPLNATPAELDAAIAAEPGVAHETSGADIDASKNAKHGKTGRRILGFFKSTAKATVQTAIGADTLKAKTGSENAKNRLGVIPPRGEVPISGPVEFKCRYKGQKGNVFITNHTGVVYIAFSPGKTVDKPLWSIPAAEIKEMKKIGGYGWKAKLVVGWAMSREVSDALEITDRSGSTFKVTAMPLRDELFNRLVAMSGQRWEAW